MKIKQKRQVRFDELLKHVWDNGVTDKYFYDEIGNDLYINVDGEIQEAEYVSKNDLFTIEEEVEITEDTILDRFVCIFSDKKGGLFVKDTISSARNRTRDYGFEFKFIYLQNEDGSIGELIWKDGEFVD